MLKMCNKWVKLELVNGINLIKECTREESRPTGEQDQEGISQRAEEVRKDVTTTTNATIITNNRGGHTRPGTRADRRGPG